MVKTPLAWLIVGLLTFTTGCVRVDQGDEVIAEGVIYYVEYHLSDGRSGGFTRLNLPGAVPGGNGSWNVDAYGRLTREFLIITYPQQRDLGPRVIPTHRLLDIQFGDGGLRKIDENRPAHVD